MPRYFFHAHDRLIALDDEGIELPDVAAALALAEHSARDLAVQECKLGSLHLADRIEVTDDDGTIIAKVTIADVIRIVD